MNIDFWQGRHQAAVDPNDCTTEAAVDELERELAWREKYWGGFVKSGSFTEGQAISRIQRLKTALSVVRGKRYMPNLANAVRPRFDIVLEFPDGSTAEHYGHFTSLEQVAEYLRHIPNEQNIRWWLNGIEVNKLVEMVQTGDEAYSLPSPLGTQGAIY